MAILLGFLPFLAAAALTALVGPAVGAGAGAALALLQIARDRRAGRETGFLEVGSFVLFAGLAALLLLTGGKLSLFAVRLAIDAGLLVIVLASMAFGRPFTLTYARREVPEHLWSDPRFLRVNQVVTGAWALAFLVMVLADAAVVFVPGFPPLARRPRGRGRARRRNRLHPPLPRPGARPGPPAAEAPAGGDSPARRL